MALSHIAGDTRSLRINRRMITLLLKTFCYVVLILNRCGLVVVRANAPLSENINSILLSIHTDWYFQLPRLTLCMKGNERRKKRQACLLILG